MKDSPGIRPLDQLRVGLDELQWAQAEGEEHGNRLRRALADRPGLIVRRRAFGALSRAWEPLDQGNGQIKLGRGIRPTPRSAAGADVYTPTLAIDGNGTVFGFEDVADLDPGDVIPDDSTWYTVLVAAADTQYEWGSLQVFSGAANVTGTGTKFTRLAGKTTDGFGRGSLIRIQAADSASGNEGIYEVDTVVDDTHLTLVSNIGGGNESGIPFSIAGQFLGATPADPDCHSIRTVQVSVVAALRDTADVTRFPICDVRRTGTTLEIVDRRSQCLYRSADGIFRSVIPVAVPTADPAAVDGSVLQQTRYPVLNSSVNCSATPAHDASSLPSSKILYAHVNSSGALNTAAVDPAVPVGTPTTTTVESSGVGRAAVARLPFEERHVIVYDKGNKILARLTTDNGGTWGSAATLMDPALNDAFDAVAQPHVLAMRNGRIVVAFSYSDDSVSEDSVRAVISDDYGDTWDDNSGVGYRLSDLVWGIGDAIYPCLAQGADDWVWLAAEQGDEIVYAYADPATMLAGTSGWSSGSTVTLGPVIDASAKLHDPSILVSPWGQVITFASEHFPSNYSGIQAAVVSERDSDDVGVDYAQAAFVCLDVTSPADKRYSPCAVALPNGQTWLVYVNETGNVRSMLLQFVTCETA